MATETRPGIWRRSVSRSVPRASWWEIPIRDLYWLFPPTRAQRDPGARTPGREFAAPRREPVAATAAPGTIFHYRRLPASAGLGEPSDDLQAGVERPLLKLAQVAAALVAGAPRYNAARSTRLGSDAAGQGGSRRGPLRVHRASRPSDCAGAVPSRCCTAGQTRRSRRANSANSAVGLAVPWLNLEQIRGFHAQYDGQLCQDFETRVARTFFEFADIGAVHVGAVREVLLRYTFGIITSNTARPMVSRWWPSLLSRCVLRKCIARHSPLCSNNVPGDAITTGL